MGRRVRTPRGSTILNIAVTLAAWATGYLTARLYGPSPDYLVFALIGASLVLVSAIWLQQLERPRRQPRLFDIRNVDPEILGRLPPSDQQPRPPLRKAD